MMGELGARVFEELVARISNQPKQLRLEPTRKALELLGNPDHMYKTIHIAGTNGKSSTSRIAESLVRAAGLRTGLFVSPHLYRVNERIQIDGEPISDEQMFESWEGIQWVLSLIDAELVAEGDRPMTYFEAITVLAAAAFSETGVEIAIIETGMGGEWDSTNALNGDVAVFTPISLDHTSQLGNTIGEITQTKAGIIKPESLVVSSKQLPEALEILKNETNKVTSSTLFYEGENQQVMNIAPAIGGQLITLRGVSQVYEPVFLPLLGDHQAQNAALALAAVELLLSENGAGLSGEVVAEGMAQASSPGRLQIISNNPPVLIDAAHNPAGAEVLAQALADYFPGHNIIAVMAVLEDKDAVGIFEHLGPKMHRLIVTESTSERCRSAHDLAAVAQPFVDELDVEPHINEALQLAHDYAEMVENPMILITGSITLIGEAAMDYTKNWSENTRE